MNKKKISTIQVFAIDRLIIWLFKGRKSLRTNNWMNEVLFTLERSCLLNGLISKKKESINIVTLMEVISKIQPKMSRNILSPLLQFISTEGFILPQVIKYNEVYIRGMVPMVKMPKEILAKKFVNFDSKTLILFLFYFAVDLSIIELFFHSVDIQTSKKADIISKNIIRKAIIMLSDPFSINVDICVKSRTLLIPLNKVFSYTDLLLPLSVMI
jgi:hypothetical protein